MCRSLSAAIVAGLFVQPELLLPGPLLEFLVTRPPWLLHRDELVSVRALAASTTIGWMLGVTLAVMPFL